MKKFLSIVLTVFMACSIVLLSGCNDKAKKNVDYIVGLLERESYEVECMDEKEIQEWLYLYGFTYSYEHIETFVWAAKGESDFTQLVNIVWCESKKWAKKLENEVNENPEVFYEVLGWDYIDFKCVRSGKIVYFGSKEVVNLVR